MMKAEHQLQKPNQPAEKPRPEQEQLPSEPVSEVLKRPQGLPGESKTQPLRQAHLLRLQRTLGNRYVQRAVIQRQGNEANGGSALPDKAPEASSLVAEQYPQLKLPEDQLAILQVDPLRAGDCQRNCPGPAYPAPGGGKWLRQSPGGSMRNDER